MKYASVDPNECVGTNQISLLDAAKKWALRSGHGELQL